MQTNGRLPRQSNGSATYKPSHSYTSSSEDSYGRMNSLSRSESGTSQTHYEDMMPSPKVLTNGYAQNSLDWGRPESPNRTSLFRPRIQDNPDPVALHLLIETAVGESQAYDVLSVEELDNLKREEAHIARQIDAVRRRLHLETKVRNAAKSLSRISARTSGAQATGDLKRQRGSENFSNEDHAKIVQKCDDLAQELWRLEKRQSELQETRLKHTAGVLQLSHQERNGQAALPDPNVWRISDNWGLGELADTEDGIMDLPGGNSKETDAALHNLWQMIVNHERNLQDRPGDMNGSRSRSIEDDEDSFHQEFSLEAFSAMVQRICTRASNLSKQQMALDAQLQHEKQQRSNMDSTKAKERSDMIEQLQDAHDQHQASQRALKDTQSQLMESRANLDQVRQEMSFNHTSALEAEQVSRGAEKRDMLAHINDTKTQLEQVEQARAQANHSLETARSQIASLEQKASENQKQHDDMEAEVVRLQTEVTVARAELDGAYGTRAQRAAEANPEVKKELEESNQKNQELQKELRELVTEHEALVKQGVEAERERDSLETLTDSLREQVEKLEVKLSEERVASIGKANNADSSRNGEATSMSVMRSEFKKMMREARAEQFKSIKAEQEEKRRLEATIRALRKESNPTSPSTLSAPPVGKSGLSRSMTAA